MPAGKINYPSEIYTASAYGTPVCGDGTIEPPEQCEPSIVGSCGEEEGCIDCQCVPISCGNGIPEPGESCDNGAQNGQVCTPTYGNSCSYCTDTCEIVVVPGPFCGDGTVQTAYEECEPSNAASVQACGIFRNGCVSCECAYYPAQLTATATFACLTEQERSFDVSGMNTYCGDLRIRTSFGAEETIPDSSANGGTFPYSITFDVPNPVPEGTIKVNVYGNREPEKNAKDEEYNYNLLCNRTIVIPVRHKNFYYCPKVAYQPDESFDYYPATIGSYASGYYDFYNDESEDDWEDIYCQNNDVVWACTEYPTDCIDSSGDAYSVHSADVQREVTVYGADWVSSGKTGGAYSFDGMDDYIDMGNKAALILGARFSQEAWIYPNHVDTNYHGFLGNPGTNSRYRSPSLWVAQKTKIAGGFGDGTSFNNFLTGNILTENAWNHLVVTFDKTTYKVYVNGIEKFSTNDFSGKTPYSTPVRYIGRVDNYFRGKIDEVKLYTYALTPQEVCQKVGKTWDGSCS